MKRSDRKMDKNNALKELRRSVGIGFLIVFI